MIYTQKYLQRFHAEFILFAKNITLHNSFTRFTKNLNKRKIATIDQEYYFNYNYNESEKNPQPNIYWLGVSTTRKMTK